MKSLLLLLVFFCVQLKAAEKNACESFGSAQDVVQCALNYHPQSVSASLEVDQSKFLVNQAKQIPNPELDVDSVYGDNDNASAEIGVLQTIEWGGKRSSRIYRAQADVGRVGARAQGIQAQIIIETIKNLHRLRQLTIEQSVVQDTVTNLAKLVAQQRSRLNLNPEQKVTLSVYKLSLADMKIKESEMLEQEKELARFFLVATGKSLAEIRAVVPLAPAVWPELQNTKDLLGSSPDMRLAVSESSFANAESETAKAAAWPALRVGPMYKEENDIVQKQSLFGFRLTMDLPVLNLNSGGRKYAQAGRIVAERNLELLRLQESHGRDAQLGIYQNAVSTIKVVPTLKEIEKEFKGNQSLAARGLISGPLVIEFNRQRLELIQNLHGRELRAIESLWHIYRYDGRIFEETL